MTASCSAIHSKPAFAADHVRIHIHCYNQKLPEQTVTDWKLISKALDSGIPDDQLERIAPTLVALETALRPLQRTIPHGADVWTGPEEAE